ncbi:IDEAL domain-containing protein [Lederbergia lenta]|uniref:IDEAL domain-containing protein n=1 Tax=Lederbergia lenta TaxID=1467 RepID=UPI0020406BFB|nr:IDEAL domain-containing protein [Lederbergia lenta]MCM3110654.1 IDEAL domain-containing protein [Lederbergia lenta]
MFAEGEWVTYQGETGWIECEGNRTGRYGVYFPNRRTKIVYADGFELKKAPVDTSSLRDKVMIDLALDTKDKEWFIEVTR